MTIYSGFYQLKMVIFHSYVSLPVGKCFVSTRSGSKATGAIHHLTGPSRRQAKGDMYSPCLSVRLTKIREPGGATAGANRCHSQLSQHRDPVVRIDSHRFENKQHCNLFENVGTVLVTRRCELIFRFCSEWESNLILLCWPSRGSEIHSCNSLKQTLLCPATTSKAVESCFSPPLPLPMDMTSAPCI